MTRLILGAQDIRSIDIGLETDETPMRMTRAEVPPERYFQEIVRALKAWGATVQDLDGAVVVTGPGSATALRSAAAIANALSFALGIPLSAIENPDRLALDALDLDSAAGVSVALPAYDRPPHITAARS